MTLYDLILAKAEEIDAEDNVVSVSVRVGRVQLEIHRSPVYDERFYLNGYLFPEGKEDEK